jgi:AcrR family transcriptional regulator
LRSTLKLLKQNGGFPELSIEAIAADANVGKATVYRWWPTKAALVADAFAASADSELRFPNTGSVQADMTLQMRNLIRVFRSERGKVVAALLAGGQSDPELIEAFRDRFPVAPPQTGLSNAAARHRSRRNPSRQRPRSHPRFALRPNLHALSDPPRQARGKLRRRGLRIGFPGSETPLARVNSTSEVRNPDSP